MKCERGGCRHATNGYGLFDYCAKCGRNLCPDHMAIGCCGKIPAESGMGADDKLSALAAPAAAAGEEGKR